MVYYHIQITEEARNLYMNSLPWGNTLQISTNGNE